MTPQSTSNAPPSPLLSLPTDILHQILRHLDFRALCALSETNTALHQLATHNDTWRHLAHRRFRVNVRTALPHRLRLAGSVCWKTLFCNWHTQRRMPISRTTGPAFHSFVSCDQRRGVRLWVCVTSADDCRLRNGALRVRLVVQNIESEAIRLQPQRIEVQLLDGAALQVRPQLASSSLSIAAINFERWSSTPKEHVLMLDEFAVVCVDIRIPDTVFEVDVLERLKQICIPIETDTVTSVGATFVDKHVWDAYELLPGGWWVRRA